MSLNKLKLIIIIITPLLLGAGCSLTSSSKNTTIPTGGVWLSTDKAQTWEQKVFVRTGEEGETVTIGDLDIYALEFHPLDSRMLFAKTNNGIYLTENSGDEWRGIYRQGPVNDLDPHPLSTTTVYATIGNKIMKNSDLTEEWTQLYVESRAGTILTQIVVDPIETDRIYAGSSTGELIVSKDAGVSWETVHNFQAHIAKIIINPRDPNEMHVGTQNGGIWVTFDRGANWQSLFDNYKEFPGTRGFIDLLYDETRNGSIIYISSYGLLWSLDSGLTWEPIELLTPPNTVRIRAASINPKNPDELYYTTDTVFYKTTDGGTTWISSNLPTDRHAGALLVDFFNPDKVYLGVKKPPKKRKRFIKNNQSKSLVQLD